jgi:hypothetical protein
VDGTKAELSEEDVKSKSEDMVLFKDLPEATQKRLAKEQDDRTRTAETAKRAEQAEAERKQRTIEQNMTARIAKEEQDRQNQIAARKAANRQALQNALAEIAIRIAAEEAEYDSASTTLKTKPTLQKEEALLTERMKKAATNKAALIVQKGQIEAELAKQ